MPGERILFVDDEELIRKLVTVYLTRQGYVVTTAADGLEATRLIAADPPDLLITDVQLPSLTGLELTKRLRDGASTARLPIIMLSAHSETDDVLAGYGQGADEYVPKPVELAVLGAKVDVLLRRASGARAPIPTRKKGVVVAFLHGKGGVGTTTLAINTGVVMAGTESARISLLDLNREFPHADMLLDLHPRHRLDDLSTYHLGEVEASTFGELLTPHASGLSVLAGPAAPEMAERITVPIAMFALDHLAHLSDYVLVDLAASFSDVNLAVFDAADVICIVTAADIASLKVTRDCLRIVDKLDVISQERTLLVLNRVTARGLTEEKVIDFVGYVPDVVVPHDDKFQQAGDEGRPYVTWRRLQPGARAIVDLASKLHAFSNAKQYEQQLWTG